MKENYEYKSLQEIITGNYQLVYIITHKNVGIIGIWTILSKNSTFLKLQTQN